MSFLPEGLSRLAANTRFLGLARWYEIVSLFLITLLGAGFEGISIAMLLPLLEFLDTGGDVQRLAAASTLWTGIVRYHAFLNVPITLVSLMLSVIALVTCRQVLDYTKGIYGVAMSERTLLRIRETAFNAYLHADLRFFYDHNIGTMINTLMLDGSNASYTFISLVQCAGFALLALTYVSFLLTINPSATILAGIVLVCSGSLFFALMNRSKRYGRVTTQYNKKLTEMLVERFGAVRLIKLSSSWKRESDAHDRITRTLYDQKIGIAKIRSALNSLIQMLVLFAGLTILYFATQVFRMGLVQVSVFIFVLLRLLPLLQEFFAQAHSTVTNSASLNAVRKLVENAKKADTIRGGGREFTGLTRGLTFRGVRFRYSGDGTLVLKDVDMEIPARRMTAVVGRSGAGKSTLADLLPRLIVPESGQILADGVDIAEFKLESLRRNIAFVSQEGFLFDASILDNVRYARPDAPIEDVRRVARSAYIEQFVESLPQGYDTLVGERGVKLSGGQRQRILLARALLQHVSVIVMDEPTSALDSESERFIQKAIDNILKEGETTLFIIAHRLSTIRAADRIYVLDEGRIVESGAHAELIRDGNWYNDMFKIQSGGASA